jgi:hypothetical protein
VLTADPQASQPSQVGTGFTPEWLIWASYVTPAPGGPRAPNRQRVPSTTEIWLAAGTLAGWRRAKARVTPHPRDLITSLPAPPPGPLPPGSPPPRGLAPRARMAKRLGSRLRATDRSGLTSPNPARTPTPARALRPRPWQRTPDKPPNRQRRGKRAQKLNSSRRRAPARQSVGGLMMRAEGLGIIATLPRTPPNLCSRPPAMRQPTVGFTVGRLR